MSENFPVLPSGSVTYQVAPVTGSGTFSISDGSTNFSATVSMESIYTFGSSGGTNVGTVINLSDATYTGTNGDLTTLRNDVDGSAGGTLTISFQFATAMSLTQLTLGTHSTTYSGSLTAVPEPTSLLLGGTATLGLLGGWIARRRRDAVSRAYQHAGGS